MLLRPIFQSLCIALLPVAASAATITPTSYSYVNAPNSSGSAYEDDSYNGTTGQLTDGFSATQSWIPTDGFGLPGPNVGWLNVNPTITFTFDKAYDFGSMIVNAQDTQGRFGVGLPSFFTIVGASASNSVVSPTFSSPATPSPGGDSGNRPPINLGIDLSGLDPTHVLTVEVHRDTSWTFLSEVSFSTEPLAAVPGPAALPLSVGALGLLGWIGRRRRR